MSGGEYDHAYFKAQEMAEQILFEVKANPNPLREKFAKHLLLVAKTMKAVEWHESGDTGEEVEIAAITKLFESMKGGDPNGMQD